MLCLRFQVSHLEDIVEQTGYVLEKDSEYCQKILEEEEEVSVAVTQKGGRTLQHQVAGLVFCCAFMNHSCATSVCARACFTVTSCLLQEMIVRDSLSGWDLGPELDHFSSRTRQVLQYMNPNKINMDLLVELIVYLGTSRRSG